LDNVVLVAALIPVVQSLAGIGFNGEPLWWGLLFGGVYGGNITMIGSTANIVALGMMEKRFNYHMRFFKWLWIGLIGGLLPTLVAQVWLTIFFR
jgi:Na+/H+ antiporter NhaD/arsenite permease-like protein